MGNQLKQFFNRNKKTIQSFGLGALIIFVLWNLNNPSSLQGVGTQSMFSPVGGFVISLGSLFLVAGVVLAFTGFAPIGWMFLLSGLVMIVGGPITEITGVIKSIVENPIALVLIGAFLLTLLIKKRKK